MSALRTTPRKLTPEAKRTKNLYLLTLFLVCSVVVLWQAHWASKNREVYQRKEAPRFRVGPNHSRFHECRVCSGKGRILLYEQDTMCPICFGVGGHFVKQEDTLDVVCPHCSAQGRVFDPLTAEGSECQVCGGRGAARLTPDTMFCPECKGTGERRVAGQRKGEPCWLCTGRGIITKQPEEPPAPP